MKKKDDDMTAYRRAMIDALSQTYKRPLSHRLGEFFATVSMLFLIFAGVGVLLFLIIALIENPVSLAILCGTALLGWMWGFRR